MVFASALHKLHVLVHLKDARKAPVVLTCRHSMHEWVPWDFIYRWQDRRSVADPKAPPGITPSKILYTWTALQSHCMHALQETS